MQPIDMKLTRARTHTHTQTHSKWRSTCSARKH